MNIGQILTGKNIHFDNRDRRKSWLVREERIKREGSPYYTWIYPVTVAAAQAAISIEHQFPAAAKYKPLDWLEIVNNDVVNLTLFMNGSDRLTVPAGTIRTVENKALWHIGIRNDDAAAASTLNSIIVTLRKQPMTIDQWARDRVV